jgi:hypothetical protein
MKYKKFLHIGLLTLALNATISSAQSKENLQSTEQLTQTNDSFFSENKIKSIAFISFSILGVAGLGLGYFFFKIGQGGKPSKPGSKEANQRDFLYACMKGDLKQAQWFLTEQNVNIQCESNLGIKRACAFNHVPLVKYLLTSPELKKHSNIHDDDDHAFKLAYKDKHFQVLEYLIFDYKIKKTNAIKELLKDNQELSNMFSKRELNEQLHNNLTTNLIKTSKNKI